MCVVCYAAKDWLIFNVNFKTLSSLITECICWCMNFTEIIIGVSHKDLLLNY